MSLQSITNLNVDFCDKKYILINAKQFDRNSRFLLVACYNQGVFFPLNRSDHRIYVRYKKPDNYSVFSSCDITEDGKVLIELTKQMLASDGICYADVIVVRRGSADINIETGEITEINNAAILSTMTFCVDVSETAVANSEIESSSEYDGLTDLLADATAEYQRVITLAQSYANGDGGGIRDNEEIDNAMFYSQQASDYAKDSKTSEENASKSEKMAMSYAVGGTGVRTGESVDNAKYYYQVIKDIVNGLNSGFIPMGTITFAELATAEKGVGFSYNISDDFVTDERFAEGVGKQYTAGTNVYCRRDGLLDCFGGAASVTATIDEVKEYLGI